MASILRLGCGKEVRVLGGRADSLRILRERWTVGRRMERRARRISVAGKGLTTENRCRVQNDQLIFRLFEMHPG